eukprot:TRINITY_DN8396_c0_g1_i2.p1 TRINITY_DN8396_c0_g1~~TRINITY_DN8396_c0_g1_i2.p1  ORF type:complete len:676 (+),score=128.08 TRINITY_DN8396_c0_g1_i2:46-2028(+)
MSSIIVDFEVLPEDGPSDRSTAQVFSELQRQLQDPNSEFRSGEFGRYAAHATLSSDSNGGFVASSRPAFEDVEQLPPPIAGHASDMLGGGSSFGGLGGFNEPLPFSSQSAFGGGAEASQGYGGGVCGGGLDTGAGHLTNPELLERIGQLERQIARTAVDGSRRAFEDSMPPPSMSMRGDTRETEALEQRYQQLSQQLEAANRELRESRESSRPLRLKLDQLETKLKDREQLLVHAKEMWMKENVRASKLADALTSAEDKLADQERRLSEFSERYAEAQQEIRQLQHLLGNGLRGAGDLAAGIGPDAKRPEAVRTDGLLKNRYGPPASNGLVQGTWGQPDVDLYASSAASPFTGNFGDEMMHSGSPSRTGATMGQTLQLPPMPEGDTNSDRFRRLCSVNDAVLYEDELLQVGVKAEYSGRDGQLAVFFGNKGHSSLQSFTAQYFVREEHALRLTASPLSQQLEADKQVVQRLQVSMLEPFVEAPWLRLQFLLPDASPRRIQMKLPIVLPKFMVGRDLTQQDFFRYWRLQHFVLNEVTSIVHLSAHLRGPLVQIARSIVFGGSLRLHHSVDSNPDNFVLVSQLAPPSGAQGRGSEVLSLGDDNEGGLSLIRVEVGSGRFTGKSRIVVRSSNHIAAKALLDCLVTQLGEPGAGVPPASVSSAR